MYCLTIIKHSFRSSCSLWLGLEVSDVWIVYIVGSYLHLQFKVKVTGIFNYLYKSKHCEDQDQTATS